MHAWMSELPVSKTGPLQEVIQMGIVEKYVTEVQNIVRFNDDGLVEPRLFKMPSVPGATALVDDGPLPPEFAVALQGVFMVAGEVSGNQKGLSHAACVDLTKALHEPMATLCSKTASRSPIAECWAHEGSEDQTALTATGEGMKMCIYSSEHKVDWAARNGMHEGKKELSGTSAFTCLPNALKAHNVLKNGSLREPLDQVVKATLRGTAVGSMVDTVLGRKGESERMDLDHDDVLVTHLNFYGHGRQVVSHVDFEGSKWRDARQDDSFRLGIRTLVKPQGAATQLGAEYVSTFRTSLGVSPERLGLHWRKDDEPKDDKEEGVEYGSGDGPGEYQSTANPSQSRQSTQPDRSVALCPLPAAPYTLAAICTLMHCSPENNAPWVYACDVTV